MGRPPKKNLPQDFLKLLETISSNITFLRESAGLNQAELAKIAKISATTLNEIEKQSCRDIRLSTIYAIANGLGVKVERILQYTSLKISDQDQVKLLNASETILRIAKKVRKNHP